MANVQLKGRSNRPGSSELVLYDPNVGDTGYTPLLEGRDFGNAEWEILFSGPRGTQGARATGAIPQNRKLVLPFRVQGSSKDQLHDRLSALHLLANELRRFGGRITWRAQGETYRQHFEIMAATAGISEWPKRYDHSHLVTQVLSGVCAPYLLGDPFDIADGFDTDTSADYTVDADTGVGLAVKGGALVPANTATTRWRHTARGHSYSDVQATLKITTGSTVASYEAHLFVNGDTSGTPTFLSAQLFGGNLRLITWVNDVQTAVLNATAFSIAANKTYWLRIRREGRLVTAEAFTSEPTPLSTPAASTSAVLSLSDHIVYAAGHGGFRLTVVSTAERYDDYVVEPFTYRSNLEIPDERALKGSIPGDVPALANLVVASGNGSTSSPIFALHGWWPRPAISNDCWNGDFEDDADGWSVAAVAGVTGAATSFVRDTTAARNKYGDANGQVVCPATANTGATFKLRKRYLAGKAYLILVWASSAAGTTNARCRLGVSGDIASCTAKALGATPALFPAIWTPAANADGAYGCFEITAATGTTLNIDGVVVCEAREAPLGANIASGSTPTATLVRVPDDWPAAPFLAIIEASDSSKAEIVRVESIAGKVLTITRGLEGTTAGGHNAPASVIPLPELRGHLEGKGAVPPVGILEGESADAGNLYTWAIAANAGMRLGEELVTGTLNAAGSAFADWLIDPNLLIPDDFAGTELAIEVWGRLATHSGLVNPKAILSVQPETATVSSGVVTSVYGHPRYSEEYGSAGKSLVKPPPTGSARSMYRLGTLRLSVDRSQPIRARIALRMTWDAGTSGAIAGIDYLFLVPAGSRCLSPTSKQNDNDYPYFMEGNQPTTKIIKSDLSGLIAKPPGRFYPDHGLGGSLLEYQQGNVDGFLALGSGVPEDPLVNNQSFRYTPVLIHHAITPRYAIARGSA